MAEPLISVPGAESLGEHRSVPQHSLRRLTPLDVARGQEHELTERGVPFTEDRDAFGAFARELRAEASINTP